MMVVIVRRMVMIIRVMLVVVLVFMMSHWLELKFRLGQLWTLVVGHNWDFVTIVQIKLWLMISI